MANKFENVPNQVNEKLFPEEAVELVNKIADPRLTLDTESIEYFVVALPEGTRHIPRLKNIPQARSDGGVSFIDIEDYLRQTLNSLDHKENSEG